MSETRKMIEIDEEKCTGCGECIITCAEGALELIDGKAKLVGDVYCDGLGACLGECPEGALTIIEREAEAFDEAAVEEHLRSREASSHDHPHAGEGVPEPTLPCGCPSSQTMVLDRTEPACEGNTAGTIQSALGHWPIKLQLLGPGAPFLKDSDLILMADCTAASFPDLHRKLLAGHTIAMGCPKLDDLEAHISRLAEILQGARPRSLTVAYMEVPCCYGFVTAAQEAVKRSGVDLPVGRIKVGRNGEILEEE
ncbi:ATP-binding protein [Thermodesulfobacteriota bacterium]